MINCEEGIISTLKLMTNIFQRMLSVQICSLQTECFKESKGFLDEVQKEFSKVNEFQMFKELCCIMQFNKIDVGQYEDKTGKNTKGTTYILKIAREPKIYNITVYIDIPFDYPMSIPVFSLPLSEFNIKCPPNPALPEALLDKIDSKDMSMLPKPEDSMN